MYVYIDSYLQFTVDSRQVATTWFIYKRCIYIGIYVTHTPIDKSMRTVEIACAVSVNDSQRNVTVNSRFAGISVQRSTHKRKIYFFENNSKKELFCMTLSMIPQKIISE